MFCLLQQVPSPQPVRIDEEARPENNEPLLMPTSPLTAPLLATKGTLTPPTLPMTHQVMWPKHGLDADQPVGNAASPKPPTPMPLAGETVQAQARQAVSPVNPEQVAVKGAVASPIEPVVDQLRTPEADVNWPIARSTEPPAV